MRSVDEIEAELTGPGGAFEIVVEEVLGERIKVFKNRNRSLREIVENSANHADNEYIICEGAAHHLPRAPGPGQRGSP